MKLEQPEPIKQENSEVKEDKPDVKPPVFDNRVSTITTIVKSEPRDAEAPKNAVSVVMAPGATAAAKAEVSREEEAGRAVVVRSSQQAKIPLKKRELKLAESFHSNHLHSSSSSSSIIVCNPSVIQAKDSQPRDPAALPNSLAPPAGHAASQQLVVTASRQELTNGRAPLLLPPHKDGQNGVIGVIGVVGHVGVIRSPAERPRAEQPELNGPSSEPPGCRAVEEGREVGRQSVLVRKAAVEADEARKPLTCIKLDQSDRKVEPVNSALPPPATEEPRRQAEPEQRKAEEQAEKEAPAERGSPVERSREEVAAGREQEEQSHSTLVKVEAETGSRAALTQPEGKQEQQGGGVNGGLAAPRLKEAGPKERPGPREEASSELQKEGIRLKIKIPPHRRNKLRGKGAKEEEKERGPEEEPEQEEGGRPLRRSARICRFVLSSHCQSAACVWERLVFVSG